MKGNALSGFDKTIRYNKQKGGMGVLFCDRKMPRSVSDKKRFFSEHIFGCGPLKLKDFPDMDKKNEKFPFPFGAEKRRKEDG